MSRDTTSSFTATSIFFDYTGSGGNPGVLVKNRSSLTLRTGTVVIRGKVGIENNSNPSRIGKIILRTRQNNADATLISTIDGSAIGGTTGVSYGKLYLVGPIVLNGATIVEAGGYYYKDGLVLPDNSTELIRITKDNYVE